MTTRILTVLIAVGLTQTALAQNATPITTFANPTPASSDSFGYSVVAVGKDRVLIGAYGDDTGAANAGAAYLFNTNGTLLTTFNNPTPAATDSFGKSVAAVGTDLVLIGADNDSTGAVGAGAAYLFSTAGMLSTITNPTPMTVRNFGQSVAAVGNDCVIIGAASDVKGAGYLDAAYLFSTNGTLLTTFNNPRPTDYDYFGRAVAGVGSDRVLIGAPYDDAGAAESGIAYLFSTNGVLITTFVNPTPADNDYFGHAVAGIGNDRVIISAYGDNTGVVDAGAAYLFSTNGTLLATFNNPTPAAYEYFGNSVAAVGNDRVLIGAPEDNTGATDTGAAYLFSTNGILLATFVNPTPEPNDYFGKSVAGVGSDSVLIGAYWDDTGLANTGAAYLFALPPSAPPSLTIAPATVGNATISWAPAIPGFVLQETESLSPVNWANSLSGAANPTVAPTTPPAKYFRLTKP
jgi:hypothetical protein